MKRILTIVVVLLVAISMPLAAEKFEGYLIDEMCSAKVVEGGADAAKAHTKDCALMPKCKAGGYGVVIGDGKFLKFDDDGDRMATKMLGFSSDKDNIRTVVNGKLNGDTIEVVAVQLD